MNREFSDHRNQRWTRLAGRAVVLFGLCLAVVAVGAAGTVAAQDTGGGLSVDIVSNNSPVEQGDVLTVVADVTNEGSSDGTQEIELAIEGRVTDTTSVVLEPGDSRTVDFTWDTTRADPGTYNASVSSDDDVTGTDVRVESSDGSGDAGTIEILTQPQDTTVGEPVGGPPTVAVRDRAGDPVPGVTVEVSAAGGDGVITRGNTSLVTGEGGQTSFDDLEMERGVKRQLVFNAGDGPSEAVSVPFNVSSSGDVGTVDIVTQPQDTTVGEPVGGPPTVAVRDRAGDPIPGVTVEVSAAGDGSITGGNISQVTSASGRATWDDLKPPQGARQRLVFTVSDSPVDAVSAAFDVVEEPCSPRGRCTVEITDTNSPVTLGGTDAHNLEINATVRNVGDLPGNQTVTLSVGGRERDSRDVRLDAGATRRLALTWTEPGPAGEYDAVVSAGNSSDSRPVRVRANSPPSVRVLRFVPCNPACEGDPIIATVNDPTPEKLTRGLAYSVSSDARDSDGSVTVSEWRVDGEVVSNAGTLEYSFEAAGEHEMTLVVTDDAGANATVSVPVEVTERTENAPPTTGSIGVTACDPECDGTPEFGTSNDSLGTEELTVVFDEFQRAELGAPDANDSDGTVVGYDWTIDGEAVGEGPELVYAFPGPGEYTVGLEVTDDEGATATESVRLRLTEATGNSPPTTGPIAFVPCDPECDGNPVLAASNDSLETESLTVSYDQMNRAEHIAPGANDSDGTIAGYEWTIDGEPVGEGPEFVYAFPGPGEYTVALEVTDDEGATATESVDLQLTDRPEPSPPTTGPIGLVPCTPECDGDPAFTSSNETLESESLTVAFDRWGQAELVAPETGDDGTEVEAWVWSVDGEFAGDDPEQRYTFPGPGEYTIGLAVRDADGDVATEQITGVLTDEPAVSIAVEPNPPVAGRSTTFEARVSDPADTDRDLRYEWSFGDGSTASGGTVDNPYDVPGNKTITLSVTTENGATTTVERTVEVQASGEDDPDLEQDVDIGGLDSPVEVGEDRELTVEAEASDPDGSVESYEWTVDGEPAGTGASLTHSFDSAGEHRVAVTVTDENGSSTTVERTVTVESSGSGDNGVGGLVPVVLGLVGVGALLAGAGYYLRGGTGDPNESSFDHSVNIPKPDGASDSGGDGDDEANNETETIIDPEPGGASDPPNEPLRDPVRDASVAEEGDGSGRTAGGDTGPEGQRIDEAGLADALASEIGVAETDARRALDAFIDTTTKALTKGNRVAMAGVGSFDVGEPTEPAASENWLVDQEGETRPVAFSPSPELASAVDAIDPETVGDIQTGAEAASGGKGNDLIVGDYLDTVRDAQLPPEKREAALSALVESTAAALEAGEAVELGDLGTLHLERGEHANEARSVVKFKPGAELSEHVE